MENFKVKSLFVDKFVEKEVSIRERHAINLEHVTTIQNRNYKSDEFQFDIQFKNNVMYCNGITCGRYNFNFEKHIEGILQTERVERIVELATSCQHSEFSSSSPSMILHQICLLTLVEILPGEKTIEEFYMERRNDMIWSMELGEVILEVTGKGYQARYSKMKEFMKGRKILLVNKYSMNPLGNDHDDIVRLSNENDTGSTRVIYSMVNKQSKSLNEEMLYSETLLRFFSKIPMKHVKACESAYVKYLKDLMPTIESSQEPDHDFIKRTVQTLVEKLEVNQTREMTEDNYYNLNLSLIRNGNYKVKNIKNKGEDYEMATCETGTLEFKSEHEVRKGYYRIIETCLMSEESYLSCMQYPEIKKVRENYVLVHLNEIMIKYISISNLYSLINRLCINRYGSDLRTVGMKKRRLVKSIKPAKVVKSDNAMKHLDMMYLSSYGLEVELDPDHILMFKNFGAPSCLSRIFADSRDVFELRMKRRVALASISVRKPGKKFKVKHWRIKGVYCECVIMGKLFEKDLGVMYVSYFTDYKLCKTQKWRLSDVESFSVGVERALALTLSLGKRNISEDNCRKMLTLYYRLLNENSWGVSKFLKPYRYFSSGVAMGSSRIKDQIPKLVKSAENYISDKLSVRYITYLLKTSNCTPGRTPAFDLNFENIGYECFILNLCPSKTYGSSRHLVSILTELSGEIDLYVGNFDSVKRIFSDFEEIINFKYTNLNDLEYQYLKHFKMIDNISELTDGRFTFSPASLLLCKRDLDGLKVRPELCNTPSLDKLSTARGSTSNFSVEPRMALESINELSREMLTGSTTRLALKLIKQIPVDLTMRMFDKDQVGGDREISILNAGFRVCQSISEAFFRELGRQTGVDLLADKLKTLNYTSSISEALESGVCRLLTIDQTRWGPNFNTITFGLLALMTSNLSTEYFIPTLICLLSEFKIFEMPILEPELSGTQGISYSLPGIVGRSHMGQGIFHYASSFYHSLSLLSIKRFYMKMFRVPSSQCIIRTYCTSDDASIIAYASRSCKPKDKGIIISKLKSLYGFFEKVIHIYGIKTNVTKNIDSSSTIEFNSMYYSLNGIGSNDLKFLYSLIDPTTTGNIYRDANMPFITFDRAVNSGCSVDNSLIISRCIYIIKLRQWRVRGHIVRPPSKELLMTGLDLLEPHNPELIDPLTFSNGLNFKRKRRIKEEHSKSENIYLLTRTRQETNLENMLNSSISDKYRSMDTYNKISKIPVPLTSIFKNLAKSAFAMSNEFFLREYFSSPDLISILKSREQKMSTTLYQKCWTKPSLFTFKILKQRRNFDFDPISYVISTRDPVKRISNLDDQESFILHMFRKRARYFLQSEAIEEFQRMDLSMAVKQLTKMRDELELSSPNVVQMIHNPNREAQEYTRQIRIWDRSTSLLSRMVLVNCVSSILEVRHSVHYTNTESCRVLYGRYSYSKGEMLEYVPTSLSEWPQVSLHQMMIKLEDIVTEEFILTKVAKEENAVREGRGDKPYLMIRRQYDGLTDISESVSQFTMDMSGDANSFGLNEYYYIELPVNYSYLATSYTLKQSMILSVLEKLRNEGGCYYQSIDGVIRGESCITYFTRSLFKEIEWIVSEKITIMMSDKNIKDQQADFLNDIYKNIFVDENQCFYPIYAMLSVTKPHYISFQKRGRRITKDDLLSMISENINYGISRSYNEYIRTEYIDRDEAEKTDDSFSSDVISAESVCGNSESDGSLILEEVLNSLEDYKFDDNVEEYVEDMGKINLDEFLKENEHLRSEIEEMMNLGLTFDGSDTDSSDGSSNNSDANSGLFSFY